MKLVWNQAHGWFLFLPQQPWGVFLHGSTLCSNSKAARWKKTFSDDGRYNAITLMNRFRLLFQKILHPPPPFSSSYIQQQKVDITRNAREPIAIQHFACRSKIAFCRSQIDPCRSCVLSGGTTLPKCLKFIPQPINPKVNQTNQTPRLLY